MKTTLPTDSAARKRYPLRTGCFNYFPAALAGVAQVSIDGNDKHNPGEPLHHARGKSSDHADCIDRHLTDVQDLLAAISRGRGLMPEHATDKQVLLTEVNQLAWRALALSQEIHETYGGAPLAPAAKLPEEKAADSTGTSQRTREDWQKIHKEELKKLQQLRDEYDKKVDKVVTYPIRPYEPRPMDKIYLAGNGAYPGTVPIAGTQHNPARDAAQAPNPQVQNGYAY